jgi:hypothetical protein
MSRVAVLVAVVLSTGLCRAEEPSRAETLFIEGKQLLERGRYAEACPKLVESYGVDPAVGTLLAVALCHEGEGKLATASKEFARVAAASAAAHRNDRVQVARDHVAAIEPLIPRVTLHVATSGVRLVWDGDVVAETDWNRVIPIDPGRHHIEATQLGRIRWSLPIEINAADTKTIEVPDLASETDHSSGTMRWLFLGSGAGLVTGSAFFGALALVSRNDAGARALAWVSVGCLGVGSGAVAFGLYLLVTRSPSRRASGLRVEPSANGLVLAF